jgi:hypothetical protein
MKNLREQDNRSLPERLRVTSTLAAIICTAFGTIGGVQGQEAELTAGELFEGYCIKCHNFEDYSGGIDLEGVDVGLLAETPEVGEKIIKRLRSGLMPPLGEDRPERSQMVAAAHQVAAAIDAKALQDGMHLPAPGLHRLNRTEYSNAIRDLLNLNIDAVRFLPPDDSSHGFDNMAGTLTTSPALMEAYLSAAGKISRLAIGSDTAPTLAIFDAPHDTSQNTHVEGLPFGTRGGMLIEHEFPADGEYIFTVKGMTGYFTRVLGNVKGEQLEVTVDGERVYLYDWDNEIGNTESLGGRTPAIPITAGFHRIGVTFLATSDLPDTGINKSFVRTMNSPGAISGYTFYPHVGQVFIEGPFKGQPALHSPSRDAIFECYPSSVQEERQCAELIISSLATKAYRRPAEEADKNLLMDFFLVGREEGQSFDSGIEAVIQRLLADPEFIYRAELEPRAVEPGVLYEISELELASRLSFFIWSSIPDEQLINLAAQGKLQEPGVLRQQVQRMMNDPKAQAFIENFTGQWLNIRGLAAKEPVIELYPDFDSTLRDAMKSEIEIFFASIIKEDRKLIDLLDANYTYVNERLAKHYGIKNVYGSQMRRIELPEDQAFRRGLLGKGALLTITSEASRTSPVKRGKWFLETFLGVVPPDPPPGVETNLEQVSGEAPKSLRQRLEQHRADPSCAACHKLFEPFGIAMENFSGVGQWRLYDEGHPIDPSGITNDGYVLSDLNSLREFTLGHSDMFVETIIEKMLTYSLGRGMETEDMPLLRQVTAKAAEDDFRFSSVILAVITSPAFTRNLTSSIAMQEQVGE